MPKTRAGKMALEGNQNENEDSWKTQLSLNERGLVKQPLTNWSTRQNSEQTKAPNFKKLHRGGSQTAILRHIV
jgi:hypothetical protein